MPMPARQFTVDPEMFEAKREQAKLAFDLDMAARGSSTLGSAADEAIAGLQSASALGSDPGDVGVTSGQQYAASRMKLERALYPRVAKVLRETEIGRRMIESGVPREVARESVLYDEGSNRKLAFRSSYPAGTDIKLRNDSFEAMLDLTPIELDEARNLATYKLITSMLNPLLPGEGVEEDLPPVIKQLFSALRDTTSPLGLMLLAGVPVLGGIAGGLPVVGGAISALTAPGLGANPTIGSAVMTEVVAGTVGAAAFTATPGNVWTKLPASILAGAAILNSGAGQRVISQQIKRGVAAGRKYWNPMLDGYVDFGSGPELVSIPIGSIGSKSAVEPDPEEIVSNLTDIVSRAQGNPRMYAAALKKLESQIDDLDPDKFEGVEDVRSMIDDYRSLERGDYETWEEFSEAKTDAFDEILNAVETIEAIADDESIDAVENIAPAVAEQATPLAGPLSRPSLGTRPGAVEPSLTGRKPAATVKGATTAAELADYNAGIKARQVTQPVTPPAGGGVAGFRTSLGSIYERVGNTTKRTRSEQVAQLHGQPAGVTRASDLTVYIDPKDAAEVGMWQTSSARGKRALVRNNEVLLTSINEKTGRRGLDARIAFQGEPAVGRSPFELFDAQQDLDNVAGRTGYSGTHPGHPITEVFTTNPVTPPAASAPSAGAAATKGVGQPPAPRSIGKQPRAGVAKPEPELTADQVAETLTKAGQELAPGAVAKAGALSRTLRSAAKQPKDPMLEVNRMFGGTSRTESAQSFAAYDDRTANFSIRASEFDGKVKPPSVREVAELEPYWSRPMDRLNEVNRYEQLLSAKFGTVDEAGNFVWNDEMKKLGFGTLPGRPHVSREEMVEEIKKFVKDSAYMIPEERLIRILSLRIHSAESRGGIASVIHEIELFRSRGATIAAIAGKEGSFWEKHLAGRWPGTNALGSVAWHMSPFSTKYPGALRTVAKQWEATRNSVDVDNARFVRTLTEVEHQVFGTKPVSMLAKLFRPYLKPRLGKAPSTAIETATSEAEYVEFLAAKHDDIGSFILPERDPRKVSRLVAETLRRRVERGVYTQEEADLFWYLHSIEEVTASKAVANDGVAREPGVRVSVKMDVMANKLARSTADMRTREHSMNAARYADVEGYTPVHFWEVDSGGNPLTRLYHKFYPKSARGDVPQAGGIRRPMHGAEDFQHNRVFGSLAQGLLTNEHAIMTGGTVGLLRIRKDIKSLSDAFAARLAMHKDAMSQAYFNQHTKSWLKSQGDTPGAQTVVRKLEHALKGRSEVIGAIADRMASLRVLKTAVDVGVLGIYVAPNFPAYLISNPLGTMRMFKEMAQYAVSSDEAFYRMLDTNTPLLMRAARSNLNLGMSGADIKRETFVDRLPVVGTLNNIQFNRILTLAKLHAFALNSDSLYIDSPIRRAMRGDFGVKTVNSRVEADRIAADHVNEAFGQATSYSLRGPTLRAFNQLAMFAPAFFESTLNMGVRTATLGPEAALARGFAIRSLGFLTLLGLAYTATSLEENEKFWDEFVDFADPRSKEWMMFGGKEVTANPLHRWRAVYKAMFDTVYDPAKLAVSAFQKDTHEVQLHRSWFNFTKNRVGILPSVATRIATQRDFNGDPIIKPGESWLSMKGAGYILNQLAGPISFNQFQEDRRRREYSNWLWGAYAFGMAIYPIDKDRDAVKQLTVEALATWLQNNTGTGDESYRLAERAVNRDRSNPFQYLIDPTTNQPYPINKQEVWGDIAIRQGWYRKSEFSDELVPDWERARRYGREDDFTEAEAARELEAGKENYFNILSSARDYQVTEYKQLTGDGSKWANGLQPFPDLSREIGRVDAETAAIYNFSVGHLANAVEAIRQQKNKLLEEGKLTDREAIFLTIQQSLDSAVYPDGSRDWWVYNHALRDLNSAFTPKLLDAYFDQKPEWDKAREPEEVAKRRYLTQWAAPYYAAATSAINNKEDYELWLQFDEVRNDQFLRANLYNSLNPADRQKVVQLDTLVRKEQLALVYGDITEQFGRPADPSWTGGFRIELALWLLQGRAPTRPDVLAFGQGTGAAGWRDTRPVLGQVTQDLTQPQK